MKIKVIMPKMGESITEGTIIKWHKNIGDFVKKDEIIFEITTDKVDTEIPSPAEGILTEILVNEQETVEIDTIVAIIDTDVNNKIILSTENKIDIVKEETTDAPSTKQIGGNIIEIVIPEMGESLTEGTIIKWHKKVGEIINKDEILLEISTDKVDTEIPSPETGILTEIIFEEQQTIPIGTVIARISTTKGIGKLPEKLVELSMDSIKSIALKNEELEIESNRDLLSGKEKQKNSFYSHVVLNIAQKENISVEELSRIHGTGNEGRVTKKDILDYVTKRNDGIKSNIDIKTNKKDFMEKVVDVSIRKGETSTTIPMDNIRQKIMQHMIHSRDTSVHVNEVMEADMTQIYNFVKNNKLIYYEKENIKLTYMPFIASACIRALRENPFINASIEGNNIIIKKQINLGIAVALKSNGLIVPNIKNAQDKSLKELALAITDLSEKAKIKKLTLDEISGGTFTISNYGIFGTLWGTPIINQPEVAILGVGAVIKKPVVIEAEGADKISIRPMMYLSLSHDHRLVDGMLGGMFLKAVKDNLENFDISII